MGQGGRVLARRILVRRASTEMVLDLVSDPITWYVSVRSSYLFRA
jgi:hypothetical protein